MPLKKIYFFILIVTLEKANPLFAGEELPHPVSTLIKESIQIIEKLDTKRRRTRTTPFYCLNRLLPANKTNYLHRANQAHTLLITYPIFEVIKTARKDDNQTIIENCYQLLNITSQLQMINEKGINTYNQWQKKTRALNLLLFFTKTNQ